MILNLVRRLILVSAPSTADKKAIFNKNKNSTFNIHLKIWVLLFNPALISLDFYLRRYTENLTLHKGFMSIFIFLM